MHSMMIVILLFVGAVCHTLAAPPNNEQGDGENTVSHVRYILCKIICC